MANRIDLVTLTLAKYEEPYWGLLRLSPSGDRFSINFGKVSFIVELWFLRGLKGGNENESKCSDC